MIQIDNTLISEDIVDKYFMCNLSACKGICCVEGDAGAPLAENEIEILDKEYQEIAPFLRPEGRQAISQDGLYYIDNEYDTVTTLVGGKECAYAIFDEKGFASCGIEKAWEAGKTSFRKPISCWLYPVRIMKIKDMYAVNYEVWDICGAAVSCGKANKIPVYRFLKEPLIAKFGEEWYEQLCFYAENFQSS